MLRKGIIVDIRDQIDRYITTDNRNFSVECVKCRCKFDREEQEFFLDMGGDLFYCEKCTPEMWDMAVSTIDSILNYRKMEIGDLDEAKGVLKALLETI